jgi:hypothetical protein
LWSAIQPDAVATFAGDVDVPRVPVVPDLADVVQVLVEHFDAVAFAIDDIEILLASTASFVRQVPLAGPQCPCLADPALFADLLG